MFLVCPPRGLRERSAPKILHLFTLCLRAKFCGYTDWSIGIAGMKNLWVLGARSNGSIRTGGGFDPL